MINSLFKTKLTMSNKNPLVEMPEQIEIPITPVKQFSIPKATAKFLLGAFILFCTAFTTSAMFQDKTLEALERTYTGAVINYHKQVAIAAEAVEQKYNLADTACDAYGALKSYKELKKIPLKYDGNPCVEFAAPQVTGREVPSPTFQ
jgi:hypothetical protein